MSNTVITVVGAVWAGGAIAYSFLRRRGTPLAILESQLRALRDDLEQELEYREPGARDRELVERTAALAPKLRELEALGYVRVVTLIEQHPERQPLAIGTWLVDPAGTTAVRVGMAYALGAAPVELATVSASGPLTSGADIITALRAARARVLAWRHAQPPDTLLEHDVRTLLGARYAQLGPRLIARMTEQLPRATLRQ